VNTDCDGTDDHVKVSLLVEYTMFTVSGAAPRVFAVTDMIAFVASVAGIPDRTTDESDDVPTMPGGTLDVNVILVPAAGVKLTVIAGIARPSVKAREGTLDVAESELVVTDIVSVFDPDNPVRVVAVTTTSFDGVSAVGVPEMSPVVEIVSPAGRLVDVYNPMVSPGGYNVSATTWRDTGTPK
jgi:hypothetical protein